VSAASDPYAAYVTSHPGVEADDLLMVTRGDSIGRALAVIHHPDGGHRPAEVRIRVFGGPEPGTVAPDRLSGAAGDAPGRSYLVEVTHECVDSARPESSFESWLFLPDNRLAAWDLQSFEPGCRPDAAQFDANDHAAMREVADVLYRAAGRGRFRYGALTYDEWDDAFASPTRASLIALLQKAATERPRDARALLRLAVGLHANGERESAIRILHRAAQLDPAWALPQVDLAVAYRQLGDRASAERALRLAREAVSGVASGPPAARELP
jgi:hypothetical protein